jgi:peptide/nickel transport system substrate-binding protein
MRRFRWQLLIVLLTGLVVGLILIFQPSTSSPVVESTPNPITGGSFTEALVGDIMRLNPALDRFNQPDRDVDRLIFSSLLKFDSRGLPVGDLAAGWVASPEGTRYVVNLRENAVWHDGTPLTSQDVLYTISLMQSDSSLVAEDLRTFWQQVQVEALSDLSLEFSLPSSFAPFLDYLTFQILPSHLLGNLSLDELVDHPFNLAPIGSGPYRFREFQLEEGRIVGVSLASFEYYYAGRPYIDEINFKLYPDARAALEAYLSDEVDAVARIDHADLETALNQPGLDIHSSQLPRLTMVFLNTQNLTQPLLQSADFRKALMAATNRQAIMDQVFSSQAVPALGPITPGNWAFYDGLEPYRYDVDLARQLLAGAGYGWSEAGQLMTAEGAQASLTLLVQDDEIHSQIATILAENWASIGIDVVLDVRPYALLMTDLESRNYQTALVDIDLSNSPDPDPYPFWAEAQAEAGQNYSQWRNTTASEYLEQARIQPNTELRVRLYRNFQILFAEDLPSLPLFYTVYNYGVKSAIKNVSIGPIYDPADRFNAVNTWYILSDTAPSQAVTPSE